MANKKDYSEIKKRRNYLPNFMVNWNRLPEYLAETNQEVQSLQISNTVVGKVTATANGVNTGEPLIVGKKYYTLGVTPGDDFSNVGWVADEVAFIATGTTPAVWTDSNLITIEESITTFYNDVDSNIEVVFNIALNTGQIIITNGLFNISKTYPVIENVVTTVTNSNTLTLSAAVQDFYFKIEIYV